MAPSIGQAQGTLRGLEGSHTQFCASQLANSFESEVQYSTVSFRCHWFSVSALNTTFLVGKPGEDGEDSEEDVQCDKREECDIGDMKSADSLAETHV